MALDSATLLAQLELVMEEFFSDASNERKREIETQLNSIWAQPDAWQHCLYCISHNSSDYVLMTCISALENIMSHQFSTRLSVQQLSTIRHTILITLKEKHDTMQHFVRNKLIKVIVDIARMHWPHDYTSFIEDIMHLGENESGVVLCLSFIQTTVEELAIKVHQMMPHHRKHQLKTLLGSQALPMLHYVVNVLERLLFHQSSHSGLEGSSSATPPPSPSSSPSPDSSNHLQAILTVLQQKSQSYYHPSPPWLIYPLPQWNDSSDEQAYSALNCLGQLLAWVPLDLVTHRILEIIFTYASYGATSHNIEKRGRSLSNTVSISALSCIQELLSRPCVPPAFNNSILTVVHCFSHLVNLLLDSSTEPVLGLSPRQKLSRLHPTYVDKVTELYRLLSKVYFPRFEHNEVFNVEQFLALLFRFSFSSPSLDGYIECMEMWLHLTGHLTGLKSPQATASTVSQYTNVLELLLQALLYKIHFRHNMSELEDLGYDMAEVDIAPMAADATEGSVDAWDEQREDTEHLTEESDAQSFLSINCELISKLADIFPEKAISLLLGEWQNTCDIYTSLHTSLKLYQVTEGGSSSVKIGIPNLTPDVVNSVHHSLRDLCTQLQLFGRLTNTFMGSQFTVTKGTAALTASKLVELGEYGARLQLYTIDTDIEVFRTDFIQVHCEVLCCIRSWTSWLSVLHSHALCSTDEVNSEDSQLLNTCNAFYRQFLQLAVSAVLANKMGQVPWVVMRCGVQLLLTLSVLVVTPLGLESPELVSLYSLPVYNSDLSPPGKVKQVLYRALLNFLLLPLHKQSNYPESSATNREKMLSSFMSAIKFPIWNLKINMENFISVQEMDRLHSNNIKECLSLLKNQLCQLSGADRKSRQLYWQCVQDTLAKAVREVLPAFSHNLGIVLEIIGCVMWAVGVVGGSSTHPTESPTSLVGGWIEKLGSLVTQTDNFLETAAANENSPQAATVTRFLHLLSLVLGDHSSEFKKLISSAITMLEEINKRASQYPNCALRQPLFAVIKVLLVSNWKYFYKSVAKRTIQQPAWEDVQNADQLTKILQAYGQSFMQPDITVFRQNLATFNLLNTKYRLYSKHLFRPMLSQFLTVLLQVLLHGSHALLEDEIISCIHQMASVDMQGFNTHFLEEFLRNSHNLTAEQQLLLRRDFSTETDLPTFSQSVKQLINDMCYYIALQTPTAS